MLSSLAVVAIGSGAGGILRYTISLVSRSALTTFPYWTFLANLLGGFLIGLLAAWLPSDSERTRLLLITGFCGGFTTFSAFSLETLELIQQHAWGPALLNIGLSVVGGIGACWIGYSLGR